MKELYTAAKSLYRLIQSGRLWNELIHIFFWSVSSDEVAKIRAFTSDMNPWHYSLGLYVDDVIFIAQDDS